VLTLYRAGERGLYRMAAGPKLALLAILSVGVLLLPTQLWSAAVAGAVIVSAYALSGVANGWCGMRELGVQLFALRWIVAITLIGQLVFLGSEAAVANTARLAAALVLAGLIVLTTRMTDVLNALERGLTPLRPIGVDAQRVALTLMITIGTVPVLARLAGEVRDAQRARGARAGLRAFVVPFLVVSLKHADQLGDALTARGVD
jgi:biotin transport system permease protein